MNYKLPPEISEFVQDDLVDNWSFIFNSESITDPIAIHIIWRPKKSKLLHPPENIVKMLPDLSRCAESLFLNENVDDGVFQYPAYLMCISIELELDRVWGAYLEICDAEGIYWDAHIDLDLFPDEFEISCYGGNHYGELDYLSHLAPGHSMLKSTKIRDLWSAFPGYLPED